MSPIVTKSILNKFQLPLLPAPRHPNGKFMIAEMGRVAGIERPCGPCRVNNRGSNREFNRLNLELIPI